MWAELVGQETVDARIWPRTAAIAERFWSPQSVTDVDAMYARLDVISRNLEFTGVLHRANFQTMLDRIAGDQPAGPLRVLADAVEALGLGTGRTGRPMGVMPLNRFVDACPPESELVRSMEAAAKRFAANPAADKDDEAMLRRQFETWAANDALFQPEAAGNRLLAELVPLSKDLSALGDAGLKLLDYLAPPTPPQASKAPAKKLSKKELAAEQAAAEAAKKARADWLTKLNADLTRLSRPSGGRGGGGGGQAAGVAPLPSPDVLLAAFRPVKALADALQPAAPPAQTPAARR
jgi:hexosaminidase